MVLILLSAALAIGATITLFLLSTYLDASHRQKVPARGQFIEIDGHRLHYHDHGSGYAVLLIHGLGAQLLDFREVAAELLKKGYRVLAVDRPGSGHSLACGKPLTIEAQADLLVDFLARLKIDRAVVAGHSMGGTIALAMAIRHPRQVEGLALLAPLVRFQETVPPALRALAIRNRFLRVFVARILAVPLGLLVQRRQMAAAFFPETPPSGVRTEGGALLMLTMGSFFTASTELVSLSEALPQIVSAYRRIAIPVRVLAGSQDAMLDNEFHAVWLTGEIGGASLTTLEGAGHVLPVTQPMIVARHIEALVQEVEETSGDCRR